MLPLVRQIAAHLIDQALEQNTGRPKVFTTDDIIDTMQVMVKCHIPWRHLPLNKGSYQTMHRIFLKLAHEGVFEKIHRKVVQLYLHRRKPRHLITDTTYIKNVMGTDVTGRNHTDRGRMATKLSTVTDDVGITLGLVLFPGNFSDQNVLPSTLKYAPRIKGIELFADKGYDSRKNRRYITSLGYRDRISRRGQRRIRNSNRKRIRIEHSYARIKQFHRLRNRHDKMAVSYFAFVCFALLFVLSHELSKLKK